MKTIKPRNGASTRAFTAILSVTNVVSFVLGVSIAGSMAWGDRDAGALKPVATAASVKPTVKPSRAKAVAKPKPKAKTPNAAAAAGASALYGGGSAPAPLPIAGKGMWIWLYDTIEGGNPHRIVKRAVGNGLTHLYVRSGSSNSGLSGWSDIAEILPVAHEAGLKVIAWDFPYLRDPGADVRRARWVLRQTVSGGHSVDGFAADLETKSEGTVLTRTRARNYSKWLRANAPGKFLVLVPPRPNPYTVSFYPYDVTVPYFDAVAPMVYWGRYSPVSTARWAIDYLKRFRKPVAPIGQSFDMGPEGGPKGHPKDAALVAFMNESKSRGSVGVSFWSWQHTPTRLWRTIHRYNWAPAPASR